MTLHATETAEAVRRDRLRGRRRPVGGLSASRDARSRSSSSSTPSATAILLLSSLLLLSSVQLASSKRNRSSSKRNRSSSSSPKRYKVISLPPFEVKLDVDLWTTAKHGDLVEHRRRDVAVVGQVRIDDGGGDGDGDEHENGSGALQLRRRAEGGSASILDGMKKDMWDGEPNNALESRIERDGDGHGDTSSYTIDGGPIGGGDSANGGSKDGGADDTETTTQSLQNLKAALIPHSDGGDGDDDGEKLSDYVRALLEKYTGTFISQRAKEAFHHSHRKEFGWSRVHSVELTGEVLSVEFVEHETDYLEDGSGDGNGGDGERRHLSLARPEEEIEANSLGEIEPLAREDEAAATTLATSTIRERRLQRRRRRVLVASESEETFASLVVRFKGTAAVLQGENFSGDPFEADLYAHDASGNGEGEGEDLYRRPDIDKDALRLAVRSVFLPPHGPYLYLSHLLTSASSDRRKFGAGDGEGARDEGEDLATSPEEAKALLAIQMEHDAAAVLGGAREATFRTDLDLYPDAAFVEFDDDGPRTVDPSSKSDGENSSGMSSDDMKESIAVFLQGSFLVIFVGGFYVYSSTKYQDLHLRNELAKYGCDSGDIGRETMHTVVVKDISPEDSPSLFRSPRKGKIRTFREKVGRGEGVNRSTNGGGGRLKDAGRRDRGEAIFGWLGRMSDRASTGLMSLRRTSRSTRYSPQTVGMDGEDGWFYEREESDISEPNDEMNSSENDELYDDVRRTLEYFDIDDDFDDDDDDELMEKGLRDSYDQANQHKNGLDMNPIPGVEGKNENKDRRRGRGGEGGRGDAVDEEMRTRSAPPSGGWGNVLDDVVPIPASDAVEGMDDKDPTYNASTSSSRGRKGNSSSASSGSIVQRRYVQPASPFDVLYGAAFLHGEAHLVTGTRGSDSSSLSRGGKLRIRSSPSARNRRKKKKAKSSGKKEAQAFFNGQRSRDAVCPMMTISEVGDSAATSAAAAAAAAAVRATEEISLREEEEELANDGRDDDDVGATASSVGRGGSSSLSLKKLDPGELRYNPPPSSFYAPANFVRNLSEKYSLGLLDFFSGERQDTVRESSEGDDDGSVEGNDSGGRLVQEDFPVEEGVIFRDFPRFDGTPCLIIDMKDEDKNDGGGGVEGRELDEDTGGDDGESLVASHLTDEYATAMLEDDDGLTFDECWGNDGDSLDNCHDDAEDPSPEDFATKLGRIMNSKLKQIEERKRMEVERDARRKEREEHRRYAAEKGRVDPPLPPLLSRRNAAAATNGEESLSERSSARPKAAAATVAEADHNPTRRIIDINDSNSMENAESQPPIPLTSDDRASEHAAQIASEEREGNIDQPTLAALVHE